MSDHQISAEEKAEVDAISRLEMARLWRFAPSGHRYFTAGPLSDYFVARFKSLGGFNAEISKEIGW